MIENRHITVKENVKTKRFPTQNIQEIWNNMEKTKTKNYKNRESRKKQFTGPEIFSLKS